MKKTSTDQTIFELLRVYHQSRENIRILMEMSHMADFEKVGFIDAWQAEMADYFERHGYCFACNRVISRCACEEPLHPRAELSATITPPRHRV